MGNWTAETLRDRVLEHLQVKAAGQAASAEDAALGDDAVADVHAMLRAKGLAPFAITAIPSWAHIPMRNYVANTLRPIFGMGESQANIEVKAEQDLRVQCRMRRPNLRVKIYPY